MTRHSAAKAKSDLRHMMVLGAVLWVGMVVAGYIASMTPHPFPAVTFSLRDWTALGVVLGVLFFGLAVLLLVFAIRHLRH